MARGSVHHIGLTVNNVEASESAFYAPVLGFLGYRRVGGPGHVSFWRDPSHGPTVHLVRSDRPMTPPKSDHCAFSVASRDRVDALHDLLLEEGIEVQSPPADFPQFGEGHYAVFFRDPDGRLFEVLHRPSMARAP